jgi:trans-2-enoyl-CoA reductase
MGGQINKKMLIILSDGGIALASHPGHTYGQGASGIGCCLYSQQSDRRVGHKNAALQAILPQMVPKDKLMRINGITTDTFHINLVSLLPAGAILVLAPFITFCL